MQTGRLPDVTGLFFAVEVVQRPQGAISATGLDDSLAGARQRCEAELRERLAFQEGTPSEKQGRDAARGTASAATSGEALSRAAFEAVERLAAQDWWAGRRASEALDAAEASAATQALDRWCRRRPRETRVLSLPTPLGLPVVAAVSAVEARSDICVGIASRATGAAAVRAAIREMFQMEFGLEIIRYRLRNGIDPAQREVTALHRAAELTWNDCAELLTNGPPSGGGGRQIPGPASQAGPQVLAWLAEDGYDVSHESRAWDDGAWIAAVDIARTTDPRPVLAPGPWSRWPLYL